MRPETIDHATLTKLVQSGGLRAAQAVGRPGGWGVLVKDGKLERPLAAVRSRQARIFKKLETLVAYLKDIGVSRFEVDVADYDSAVPEASRRPDRAAAMRQAHEAVAHDAWFRAQVRQGMKEADDPAAVWLPHATVKKDMQRQRAALERKLAPRRK